MRERFILFPVLLFRLGSLFYLYFVFSVLYFVFCITRHHSVLLHLFIDFTVLFSCFFSIFRIHLDWLYCSVHLYVSGTVQYFTFIWVNCSFIDILNSLCVSVKVLFSSNVKLEIGESEGTSRNLSFHHKTSWPGLRQE